MGKAIKQDLSPDLNPIDYVVLQNKENAYISLLKTAIKEEWNKMSEEFILKTCKSFQRHDDTIIEKIPAIFSKFTDSHQSS